MKELNDVNQKKIEIIERWKHSGLSQKEFCLKENIGYHIFHYWYKKYKIHNSTVPGPGSSGFVSLEIEKSSVVTSPVEIHLPNGIKIFCKSLDSAFIKSLM